MERNCETRKKDDYTKILSYKSSILIQQTRNNSVAVKSWSSDFKIDRFKNSNNWHFPFSILWQLSYSQN